MRLQRALARAGVASRRSAEDLIRAGRVRVNGVRATIGQTVDPASDEIRVSGRTIQLRPSVWLALHKPVGYVVTKGDPGGRPTIFELVPSIPGLTYVGRLDINSSGLVLLTTDGRMTNRLLHPRYEVERSYRVRVHGRTEQEIQAALGKPIVVEGRPARIVRFTTAPARGGAVTVSLVLTEGRYRIVRRVCAEIGLTVDRLERLGHGPIRLGRLAVGAWRYLTTRELAALDALRAA